MGNLNSLLSIQKCLCRRAKVPLAVLAGHGLVHVLFVVLAGVATDWAMQQQIQRIQVIAPCSPLPTERAHYKT